MKKIFTYVFICLFSLAFGQAPSGYYNGTSGLSKAELKTKLAQISANGHKDLGYGGLWNIYETSDRDHYFENDNSIMDMYSENPTGKDPYNFTYSTDQCGSTNGPEGYCYNREHIIPQSIFNQNLPMRSDAHHVVPSDQFVNGKRGNFPIGIVKNPDWTSLNGSKLGTSNVNGYSGTVFEPIDEFKGDFARIFFYFVTRYESNLSSFIDFDMFNKTTYPSFSTWSLPMLLEWHKNDPVSKKEIDRNEAIYKTQGNRNPFIDVPQFVEAVWGDGTIVDPGNPDTEKPTIPVNLISQNLKDTSVELIWNTSTDNIGVNAYKIYSNGVLIKTVSVKDSNISNIENTFGALITGLQPETTYEFQVTAIDTSNNESDKSNAITITTLKAEPGTLGTCGIEDFEKAEDVKDTYKDISWTNNNITWSANNARTDKNINNKAVTFRRLGTVKSSTISGGIGNLKLSFINSFTNNNSVLKIKVISATETKEFTFPVTQTLDTKTVSVNIDKPFTFEFSINEGTSSTSDDRRITIDDVSWDCYTLSTNEIDIKNNNVIAYPNPIKNQEFSLQGLKGNETINVYSSTGQLVQTFSNVQNRQKLMLRKLPKGIYILKSNQFSTKVIVE